MNTTAGLNRECLNTLRLLDRWMDRELGTPEASTLEAHLSACPDCAAEVETRNLLRQRVRTAAVGDVNTVSPYLKTRVTTSLRHQLDRSAFSWFGGKQRLSAAAAMVVVIVGTALVSRELGYLRFTAASREHYLGSISARVSSLMSVALGDHIHCAVYGEIPRNAPMPGEIVNELPLAYRELLPLVQKSIGGEFRIFTSHTCRYKERQFLHLAMKNDSHLVSLIVTPRLGPEHFNPQEAIGSPGRSGVPVYASGVQRFQIAGFETEHYLAYIVSDMPKELNAKVLLALQPAISEFLAFHKS